MTRAILLLLIAVLAGCASKSPPGVRIDASIEKLVPSDTVLLVGAHLDSLLKTPLYQENFADRQIPQIEEFAKRTGVKDLSELLYASNGRQGILLVRGKLDGVKGIPRSTYKGLNFYGDDRNAVVLFSSTVGAAGDVDALHSLIDKRGQSDGVSPALAAQMKEIPATAQVWAAYSGGPIHLPFDNASPLANLNKLIASVQTGAVYFDLRDGLNGLARADCTTDQDAEQVSGAVRALIGIGRLSVPKNHPELAQVYDTLRVTQEARRVRLYAAVPQPMVDQFLGMWLHR